MSTIPTLSLRRPPGSDFVIGYPGIPADPSSNRPHAAVRGTVELRVGPEGVKSKWVRIDLRKVETLPGGGEEKTFVDFVGLSPVTLWRSSSDDGYEVIQSRNFPFIIRIPESVPPTVTLENKAGIHYELVASIRTLGKRHIINRKTTTSTAVVPIIINKHELHTSWPIYDKSELLHATHAGVILTVSRERSCYGPGDEIVVNATVGSNTPNRVVLERIHLELRESIIFRPGTSQKLNAPVVKTAVIAEVQRDISVETDGEIKQGTEHDERLVCTIPSTHRNTTLSTARHIDLAYTLNVRAVFDVTVEDLVVDLPVMVSNWPKSSSEEAVIRIGPVPGLSASRPTSTSNRLSFIPPRTLTSSPEPLDMDPERELKAWRSSESDGESMNLPDIPLYPESEEREAAIRHRQRQRLYSLLDDNKQGEGEVLLERYFDTDDGVEEEWNRSPSTVSVASLPNPFDN